MSAIENPTWFELREPGCVPERKGPVAATNVAAFLREIFEHRPGAYVTVIAIGHDGPSLQDGPECLQMIDGRSMSTARKHIASSRHAHVMVDKPEWCPSDIWAAASHQASICESVPKAMARLLMAERERAAVIASGDCDWSQFSRTAKTDWRGDETNIFAPPAEDDGTMPTDVNVFAYRIGVVSGRAIAAAIRNPSTGA